MIAEGQTNELQKIPEEHKATLVERYTQVKNQLAQAAQNANRPASDVQLLAVSKTKPVWMIQTLASEGQQHFGENYLQEALEKQAALRAFDERSSNENIAEDQTNKEESSNHKISKDSLKALVWHYIGHIQRNKTRDIAEHFDWVHTIERGIIAKRLNDQRPEGMPALNVLIQVNIDDEDSKSGCQPAQLNTLVKEVLSYERLQLRGLMIIPAKTSDSDLSSAFQRTQALFVQIQTEYPELTQWDTLSMGMSGDMAAAVAAGSTMVRVGSAIFGARD